VFKKSEVIIIVICIIVLATYAITGFYSFPSGDDFDYACLGRNNTDFLGSVLNERTRWNGRYISNFFVLGSPLNKGGIALYQIIPSILILFIWLGTFTFFKLILNLKPLLISLVSTVLVFSIMPDITEGIYWYTGAISYIPAGTLFLISLSLLYNYWFEEKKWLILPLVIIQTIASGFNEIIPILATSTFTFIWLYNLRRWDIALLSLFQFALFYYVISAPGNSVRDSYFSEQHQVWFSFQKAWQYTIRFIGEWILNPGIYFWIITLILIKIPENLVNRLTFLKRPLVIFFVLVGPTYLGAFGPLWSTGLLGQYRTENLASYFFVCSLSIVVIANSIFLSNKLKFVIKPTIVSLGLMVFLLIWKNQFFLFKELASGEIFNFEKEMNARIELLEHSENKDVYLLPINYQTRTLFVYPLTDNPNDWKNQCYGNYYRTKKVYKK
jgi:hypothetical protein